MFTEIQYITVMNLFYNDYLHVKSYFMLTLQKIKPSNIILVFLGGQKTLKWPQIPLLQCWALQACYYLYLLFR